MSGRRLLGGRGRQAERRAPIPPRLPEPQAPAQPAAPPSAGRVVWRRLALVPLLAASLATAEENALSLAARLGGGVDTATVPVPDEDPLPNEAGDNTVGGSLGATWHALRAPGRRLDLGVGGDWAARVGDGAPLRSERVGATIAGTLDLDGRMPGLALAVDRWAVDEDGVATTAGAVASLALPAPGGLAWPALEARWLDWDDRDDADGVLLAGRYRHWFLLAPDDAGTRIEFTLRAGRFLADEDPESYVSGRGEAAIRWRTAGAWEWSARAWGEWRGFDQARPGAAGEERQALGGALLEIDRRLTRWLSAGAYGAATVRVDSLDDEGYERWQAGVRMTATH